MRLGRPDFEHGAQFVEDGEHKFSGAPEKALQRATRSGLENHCEIAIAGKEG
jgi:hypothetical protein